MRVGWHGSITSLLGAGDKCAGKFRQLLVQMIDGSTNVQTQISCSLLITAAATVEFVSRIAADQRDELLLDEVMNVLSFFVLKKLRRRGGLLADLSQPLQDGDQLARREHTRRLQSLSVRPAGRQFMFEQP